MMKKEACVFYLSIYRAYSSRVPWSHPIVFKRFNPRVCLRVRELSQNWQFWRILASVFQLIFINFLNCGMETIRVVFFEKIKLYIPGNS